MRLYERDDSVIPIGFKLAWLVLAYMLLFRVAF
jgi:hypothetical protein